MVSFHKLSEQYSQTMIKPYLYIRNSKLRGRGIFTRQNIPANTTVEVAPVIELPVKDVKKTLRTKLHQYVFCWGISGRKLAVALGYASIYNHLPHSNCEYTADFNKNTLSIKTKRAVKKGEQLFVNYHCDSNDESPVWFEVR